MLISLVMSMTLVFSAADELEQTVDLDFWAYETPVRPEVPRTLDDEVAHNPIDAFLLEDLRAKKITPVPAADRPTLLRRASFDLTGLPPTPEELRRYLADRSPDAYEKQIDRLLSSPHYGERWARHWLDVVRYADSKGFKSDLDLPRAYRYRDYVIRSLNADKPYDRFVMEQIAGDELFPNDPDALIATGLLRLYPDEDNARDIPQRRQEILNDITDTVGAAFLGLTFGCARCHDHKFDPIEQEDYYRLQAFFAGIKPVEIPLASHRPELAEQKQRWEEKTSELRRELESLEAKARENFRQDRMSKFPPEVTKAVNTPPEKRTPLQQQIAHMVSPQIDISDREMAKKMKKNEKWQELTQEREKSKPSELRSLGTAMAFVDIGREVPPTFLLLGGSFGRNGREVTPSFPYILSEESANPSPLDHSVDPTSSASSGRRRELARWLVQPDNPLTARVVVNRLWHHHFGRGIVRAPSDFGAQGLGPSNHKLLDWLATELVGHDWSLKAIHRMMMTSAAYRRASTFDEWAYQKDPENILLWRQRRRRLEAEAVRDSMLAVSGELNRKMFGPGVFPPLPKGFGARAPWPVSKDPANHVRRSVYIFVRRNLAYPLLSVLDLPNSNIPCAAREVTTTAPQALTLINSALTLNYAKAFAARLIREVGTRPKKMIKQGYLLAYSRPAHSQEIALAQDFLEEQAGLIADRQPTPKELALPIGDEVSADLSPPQAAALVDFCHALLNSNEFIYVD